MSTEAEIHEPPATVGEADHVVRRGKTVLLAIDGSPHAEYAVNYYLDQLHTADDNLILVHSPDPPRIPATYGIVGAGVVALPEGIQIWEDAIQLQMKELREIKEKYNRLMQERKVKYYQVRVVQNTGNPGPTIVQIAEGENVQLVVMGTRGMSGIRRTILGSVSDYVVHHAQMPVTICHLPKDHPSYKTHHWPRRLSRDKGQERRGSGSGEKEHVGCFGRRNSQDK